MQRRNFLLGSGAATLGLLSSAAARAVDTTTAARPPINLTHDGLALTPPEYARLLGELTTDGALQADNYSNGGVIAELEQRFAQRLGKPAAVFMPSGTLANHLAVRTLAGTDRRVLVQADSHLYCDSGDAATVLSGLQLVPLAMGRPSPTLEEVQQQVERGAAGRVPTAVGVVAIESPVRRHDHRMVDVVELQRITDYARARGIRLHLDGARLFNLPQHSGRTLAEWTAPFDTVYVSLWKHFNAMAGAVLAGERALIENLYHVRRMFGGSLPQAWPVAAVALRYLEGYEQDYAAAWRTLDACFAQLPPERFELQRMTDGTSKVWLTLHGIDAVAFATRLAAEGIAVARPSVPDERLPLLINTSLARIPGDALAAAFLRAAAS
jgi:threonine aldolase